MATLKGGSFEIVCLFTCLFITLISCTGLNENQPGLSDRVSLGQKCANWSQCQEADPNSGCLDGTCQCVMENNHCGRNNTGCHPLTFQVFLISVQSVILKFTKYGTSISVIVL